MSIRKALPLLLLTAILLAFFAPALAFPAEKNALILDMREDESPRENAGEASLDTAPPKSDIEGHWAQKALQKGIDTGLLQGYEDGSIRPDNAITTAQMITILTRVLGASKTAATSVGSGKWYYEAAQKAAFLGLIGVDAGNLDVPMSRQDAFAMMAKAFALTPASPDLKALGAFSDSGVIKAENKAALAALVSGGLVQGYAGALNVNGGITRAEFLTILFRVADSYIVPSELENGMTGGAVVRSGDGVAFKSFKLAGNLWLDCAAESVSLDDITVGKITLKSHALKALTLRALNLERLVIDCGSANVALGSLEGSSISVLQLHGGGGLAITDSVVKTIEISGDKQSVTIGGKHDKLIISGSKNNVTLLDGAELGEIVITGGKNTVKTQETKTEPNSDQGGAVITKLTVGGNENQVFLTGKAPASGVDIPGNAGFISLRFPETALISLGGNYNTLNCLDGVSDTLRLTGSYNKLVLSGSVINLSVDGRKNAISGSGAIHTLTLNAGGNTVDCPNLSTLNDNSRDYDVDRVLALVTYTYQGDYTLAWAQNNDYEDYEKEIWVNAKGYSSQTGYLIWVNLAMQRANIFTGTKGDWTLLRSCIIGSGSSRSGTPIGVYYTTYKLAAGWTTSSYSCRPVVGFKAGSGYAFHSRLYYPNSTNFTDDSIGYPVSHGCIRMYDEDINFIFNEIPLNTTVVIH